MTSATTSPPASAPTATGFSRFMLGTVQFGLPYGVANRAGQPAYADVVAIVAAAIARGVTCFDTAAVYGTSEEVLGRALRDLRAADRVTVVTKTQPFTPDELASPARAARALEASVEASRRRLGLDCLPLVLFHREADAIHFDALLALRDRGWLRAAGVSCDNRPGPAAEFAARAGVAALQLPANILDPRHRRGGSFAAAAHRGVAVFVRSVYLQGLLLMPEADIPEPLRAVVPARRAIEALAAEAGIGVAELAVRFMLGLEGVTSLVMGVDTVPQLEHNLAIVGRGPLDPALAAAVTAAIPQLPEMVVSPPLWPKRDA
ncbi:MAG: aldo/keto reductase [Planctomycetia bacterium]